MPSTRACGRSSSACLRYNQSWFVKPPSTTASQGAVSGLGEHALLSGAEFGSIPRWAECPLSGGKAGSNYKKEDIARVSKSDGGFRSFFVAMKSLFLCLISLFSWKISLFCPLGNSIILYRKPKTYVACRYVMAAESDKNPCIFPKQQGNRQRRVRSELPAPPSFQWALTR
jgi:hypothetical protein